jgi:hypothetical protein
VDPDLGASVAALTGAPGPERLRLRLPDAPTAVHLASLAGAFAFWTWLDRGLWFFGDEWDFLVRRGLSYGPTNPMSIWFPHNEHWSTLPVLLWRALFGVFHLGTYWPYIIPVLLAQVGVMHLSWRLCRRAGVDSWVATAAVALLGFLGAGAEDLTWGFQIGFVGSVLFGLLAFDLLDQRTDGDGPFSAKVAKRRDLLVSLALLAALMCSTIGDAMVVGAAVLAAARLPYRRVIGAIGPPVVLYALWFAVVGHLGLASHSDQLDLSTFTNLPSYVWTGLSAALGQSFNLSAAGGALLVGLGAWVAYNFRALWREAPALLGLGAAVLVFYALAAVGRDATTVSPTVSRYVYVALALLLPAIARLLTPRQPFRLAVLGAVALLVFSALGNIGQARTWSTNRVATSAALKTEVLAVGRLLGAGVKDVSGPTSAPVASFPDLSASSLAHLERSHLLPSPPLSGLDLADGRALLALGSWNGSTTALSRHRLFPGKFVYMSSSFSVVQTLSNRCLLFSPTAVSPPVQIRLKMAGRETSASVQVNAPPAPVGSVNYLAAVLVPRVGPTTPDPVELTVPGRGTGFLDDNDPDAQVVVTWNVGSPLTLCGLAR